MINIKHHLSNTFSNPEAILAEKSEAVWLYLNKEKIVGSDVVLRGKSITSKAQAFLEEVKENSHSRKYTQKSATRHCKLMECILKGGMLKKLITAEPKELNLLATKMDSILTEEDFEKRGKHISFSELLLSKVFNYKAYRDTDFCSKLYIDLQFSMVTCPYCNEYPVKVVQNAKGKNRKPMLHFDLDHFYPKHFYPYLALSFYNHIPCCKYCNSLHKKEKRFSVGSHIHPYLDNFDSVYLFSYSHGVLIGRDVESLSIINNTGSVENLCKELELEQRYQNNLEYAKINNLVNILIDNVDLFFDENRNSGEDLKRLKIRLKDFGLIEDPSRIMERPWSKMQRDLVKFFDVNNVLFKE